LGLCCVGPSLKLFQEDGVVVLVLSKVPRCGGVWEIGGAAPRFINL